MNRATPMGLFTTVMADSSSYAILSFIRVIVGVLAGIPSKLLPAIISAVAGSEPVARHPLLRSRRR
jgi:hypothetical protein